MSYNENKTPRLYLVPQTDPLHLALLFQGGGGTWFVLNKKQGKYMVLKFKPSRLAALKGEDVSTISAIYTKATKTTYPEPFQLARINWTNLKVQVKDVTAVSPDIFLSNIIYIIELALGIQPADANVEFYRTYHCCKCGLPMTNPQSVEKGFGSECADQMQRRNATQLKVSVM